MASKQAIFRLILPLLGIVVALLLFEIVFRLFASSLQTPRWSDRPLFYYRHADSKTLQDYPYSAKKPDGAYRIVVLGDSFSFAPHMQFDDTFAKRLERMLNMNSEKPVVEVLNFGLPGVSTFHQVPLARQALKQDADLLLLQVTLNDVQKAPFSRQELDQAQRFGRLKFSPRMRRLTSHWKSLGFVLRRLHNLSTHREYKGYYFRLFGNESEMRIFEESLQKLSALADKHKVPLVAVVFPLFGVELDQNYPFFALHQVVAEKLKTAGIPALDLLKVFQGIPLARLQVIPGEDMHPNEIAHRLSAERIYLWLTRNDLLPAKLKIKHKYPQRTHQTGISSQELRERRKNKSNRK